MFNLLLSILILFSLSSGKGWTDEAPRVNPFSTEGKIQRGVMSEAEATPTPTPFVDIAPTEEPLPEIAPEEFTPYPNEEAAEEDLEYNDEYDYDENFSDDYEYNDSPPLEEKPLTPEFEEVPEEREPPLNHSDGNTGFESDPQSQSSEDLNEFPQEELKPQSEEEFF